MKSDHIRLLPERQLRIASLSYLVVTLLLSMTVGCSPFARLQGVIVDDRLAQGTELSKVRVVRDNEEQVSAINMSINKGDFIYTDSETQAVLVSPNWEVVVLPGSKVEMGSIFDWIGDVVVKTIKHVKDEFKVKSEYVTAGAEGTEFLVTVDRDGVTEVTVAAGKVRLEFPDNSSEPVYVTNRMKATVTKQGGTVSSSISDARRIIWSSPAPSHV